MKEELVEMIMRHYHGHARYQAEELVEKLRDFVAEWIEDHNGWGDEGAQANAQQWRKDMA
jgi:hypothetical protein